MKAIKYLLSAVLLISVIWSCDDDDFGSIDFVDSVVAPSNLSAAFEPTQDNSGVVTIIPNGEGVVSYSVDFGDGSSPETVQQGESVAHAFPEGTYEVKLVGTGITGLKAEANVPLTVSFQAPVINFEETSIVNSASVSKGVEVTVNAEFAISYDVYFGELGMDDPVSANIGETAYYAYAEPGTYTIRVVVKGTAIETTEFTQEFEAISIVQPIASAPAPAFRFPEDVISIYTSSYDDIPGSDFFPDWGQAGQGSGWATFDLNGDEMLNYINLSYQGIQLGATQDVTTMETLHIDIWTADDMSIDIYPLQVGVAQADEKFVTKELVKDQWNSFDIPLSEFTDQGLSIDQIHQFKFTGNPWAGGTVFIDNIYFWKESTGPIPNGIPVDFEDDFAFRSFDGGDISVIANPDTNGNASSMVAQLVKGEGQPWAGSVITSTGAPYGISEGATVTAKVWSPRAGQEILMKFEDATPWPDTNATADAVATTTVANAWEEITWTLTGVNSSFEFYNMVLIMDNGTNGDGSENFTVYLDDFSVASYLDFEAPYSLDSFDGGEISVIDNPDTSGNPSAKVAQMVKGEGQAWAGSKITTDLPILLSENMEITVKVWSPRAGLELLMKFEDATPWPDTNATAELIATTTVAGAWEELTYTVTGVDSSLDYYNIVLIMDNGTNGDGSADYTIYVDDISSN